MRFSEFGTIRLGWVFISFVWALGRTIRLFYPQARWAGSKVNRPCLRQSHLNWIVFLLVDKPGWRSRTLSTRNLWVGGWKPTLSRWDESQPINFNPKIGRIVLSGDEKRMGNPCEMPPGPAYDTEASSHRFLGRLARSDARPPTHPSNDYGSHPIRKPSRPRR